jgi:hypothetical protein
MHRRVRRLTLLVTAVTAWLAFEPSALAFKPVGHEAIEALAYRHLLEMPATAVCESDAPGVVDRVPGKEVLRLLIAVGALSRPECFDAQHSSYAGMACGADGDGRGAWPVLGAGAPDDLFARQFGGTGQCFHFMAQVSDVTGTETDPELGVARGLVVDAYQRCTRSLDNLWLELLGNPGGARTTDRGLYALIHSVQDSFSDAHVERDSRGRILYLRAWDLLSARYLVVGQGGYFGTQRQHQIEDERDDGWRSGELSPECPGSDDPYALAQHDRCFSPRGQRAAEAVKDLLEVTYCAFRQRSIPKIWTAGRGPIGEVTPSVRRQWTRLMHTYLQSARVAPAELPSPTDPYGARAYEHPERIPELLIGARGRLGSDRLERSGDVGLALEAFPPLKDSYPFIPLAGIDGGLRWVDSAPSAGFSVTFLSAMLPLSEGLALGLQPATLEAYWKTDRRSSADVELLSSIRADVFLRSGVWISLSLPRRAWIAHRFRRDWGLTVGYAWDVNAIAGLGESGYRNAGVDWDVPPVNDAPPTLDAARQRLPTVVIGSFGAQVNADRNAYGVRVVLPEVLVPQGWTSNAFDAGIGAVVTSVRDTKGDLTSIGLAPELRLYVWSQRWLGLGITPLEVDAAAEEGHDGTLWQLSTWAHAALRLWTVEVGADVPLRYWRGGRFSSIADTPVFLRFGWVQKL